MPGRDSFSSRCKLQRHHLRDDAWSFFAMTPRTSSSCPALRDTISATYGDMMIEIFRQAQAKNAARSKQHR